LRHKITTILNFKYKFYLKLLIQFHFIFIISHIKGHFQRKKYSVNAFPLPIPYKLIKKEDVVKLDHMIRHGDNIEKILEYVDRIVLEDYFSKNDILKINKLQNKLLDRRIKQKSK
jgi:hypothetical protein